jgi:hypothetical protein
MLYVAFISVSTIAFLALSAPLLSPDVSEPIAVNDSKAFALIGIIEALCEPNRNGLYNARIYFEKDYSGNGYNGTGLKPGYLILTHRSERYVIKSISYVSAATAQVQIRPIGNSCYPATVGIIYDGEAYQYCPPIFSANQPIHVEIGDNLHQAIEVMRSEQNCY